MSTATEKKIELINQLLAKAEKTTPEEAEALTEHAERLMVKYMIDQSVLEAKRSKAGSATEQIITRTYICSGSYQKPLMQFIHAIGRAYGNVEFMKSNGRNTISLHMVGFQSDVDQLYILAESLHIQSTVAMSAWWKANKNEFAMRSTEGKWYARAAFLTGFGDGAARRMRDNRASAIQEAEKESSGTELAIIDRGQAVQAYMSNLGVRKGRATKKAFDHNATSAGFTAGQNSNTGEKGLSHTKQLN